MGQPLNKKLCEIQIEGAMVMGIGQACLEDMLFNDPVSYTHLLTLYI